jgi:hypothetical protein
MNIDDLADIFSQKSGVQQSMGSSIMSAIIGFMAQKMMGQGLGSMLSGSGGPVKTEHLRCGKDTLSIALTPVQIDDYLHVKPLPGSLEIGLLYAGFLIVIILHRQQFIFTKLTLYV